MFCSDINGGEITSFNDQQSVSVSDHPKKGHAISSIQHLILATQVEYGS